MRRIVLSLAVLSAVALSACSGGGSVLNFENNSTPDHVIVTVVGPSNIARVLPGAALPLSAVAVKGSQNGFTNINRFRWSAELLPSGTYIATADGSTKPCGNITVNPTGGPSFLLDTDLNTPPYSTIAIDPVNEGNILFIPPPVFAVPTGLPVGSSVATNYPYCVVVSATPLGGGTTATPIGPAGSIIVAVVNPQSPTQ